MEIADSARKHEVSDADMLHAAKNAYRGEWQGADRLLLIGLDRTGGHEIEVVVIDPEDDPVIIHARKLP